MYMDRYDELIGNCISAWQASLMAHRRKRIRAKGMASRDNGLVQKGKGPRIWPTAASNPCSFSRQMTARTSVDGDISDHPAADVRQDVLEEAFGDPGGGSRFYAACVNRGGT
jgi:hypothetical protein